MSWLRDRRAPADDGTRIGWIAQLRRAFLRWLTLHSGLDGNPYQSDAAARCANLADRSGSPSPLPPHAQPNQVLSADEADTRPQTDVPPPTAEIPSPEPERESADSVTDNPSGLAARVAREIADEMVPAPFDLSPPDSITREEPAGSPAELAEPTTGPSDQDQEVDQEAPATAIKSFEPATRSPSSSTAPANDPRFKPKEGPPAGSFDHPLPAPPPDAEEGTDVAPPIDPLPNDDSGLDADQPVQQTEDVCSPGAAGSIIHDTKKIADASSDHSQGKPGRQASDGPRQILRYRPRLRPPPAQAPSRAKTASPESPDSPAGTLEALYLITFLPGGWGLDVSVLLGRVDGMPENLNVRAGGDSFPLFAIDENLFEPIQPSDGNLIATGFIAESEENPVRRWVRTTRDLHAFSQRPGVSGFASVPRVLIGQENVVLCKSGLVATIQQCASATGSDPLLEVRGPGIPDGWNCFRRYSPRHPADFGDADEIFLALNPLPDASIQLSGGISSTRGTWVLGAPPVIRVLGAVPDPNELTIDGKPATESSNEGWIAPGWDTLGTHTIQFSGLSRTYEIARIEEDWPSWATAEEAAFSACGARVSAATGVQALAITGGPYWLVGASAGDLSLARRSSQGVSIAAPSIARRSG